MKMTTKPTGLENALPRGAALHALHGSAGVAAAAAAVPLSTWHAPQADNDTPLDNKSTRAEFLRILQREKRRTDRSHSALSLVLVEVDNAQLGARNALLTQLRGVVRETDYAAAIDGHLIAFLLPDTGDSGLTCFLAKVLEAQHAHVMSTAGATYPDPSFEQFVAERLATSRLHAVECDARLPGAAVGYPLKRALDVLGATFALTALLPLIVVIALLIKLTSPGPVIFRQQRIGKAGRPFTFFKFRSMRNDNDDRVHRDFVASLIDGKVVASGDAEAAFKIKKDARVTPIGRFIRKTSIDEIPQFFNVLRGDMSLVGPRPPVMYEADCYKSWHRRRVLELKPGLTGIWQVEGRSRVSFDDMVRMDLRYLRDCSLAFDLKILLRTVVVVLRCHGAQ